MVNAESPGGWPRRRALIAGLVLALALAAWLALDGVARATEAPGEAGGQPEEAPMEGESVTGEEVATLQEERQELLARLEAIRPKGAYVVVDRGNNRIYLRRGTSVVVDALASTGSRAVLQETTGPKRTWVFETPAGRFSILSKRPDPVWTKPDWAFLEAGEPIPDRVSERREYGSLGEYALDLGEGYMIHGTLYERLLGRSVTHGCVRVGRDALRTIARQTRVGSQVFIY